LRRPRFHIFLLIRRAALPISKNSPVVYPDASRSYVISSCVYVLFVPEKIMPSLYFLSECPKSFCGLTTSRISCLSSLISGNRPATFLSHTTCPSIVTDKRPLISLETSVTPYISSTTVVNNSLAMEADRSVQPHLGQYTMVIVGFLS